MTTMAIDIVDAPSRFQMSFNDMYLGSHLYTSFGKPSDHNERAEARVPGMPKAHPRRQGLARTSHKRAHKTGLDHARLSASAPRPHHARTFLVILRE